MKRLYILTLLLGLGLVILRVSPMPAQSSNSDSEIQRGLNVSPVPVSLQGANRSLVALGSYIVNAQASCTDCHTCPTYTPGQNPYMTGMTGPLSDINRPGPVNASAFLAGGVPFGPFTSRNLTPDATGKPAGLTLEQFMQVIRTGVDLDHQHPMFGPVLQVMPWPVLRHMTDRDLAAIYAYLSAIPHAETPAPGTCSGAGE